MNVVPAMLLVVMFFMAADNNISNTSNMASIFVQD